jgi:hypothetical protein
MSAPLAADSSSDSMASQDATFFDRVHDRARRRRKNPWNLLLALFCLIGVGGAWAGIAHVLVIYRSSLYPPDTFLFSGTRIGNILMFVTPCFPSIALGLIIANLLVWCISPARRAFKKEADGVKGEDFRSAQFGLAKAGTVLAAIGLPLCLLGANNFWALTPDGIHYRPMLSATTQHYAWSSVERIETGCSRSKNSVDYNFVVTLPDQTRIDLMEESPDEFLAAYPRIQSALRGHRYRFDAWALGVNCRPWQAVRKILSQQPSE